MVYDTVKTTCSIIHGTVVVQNNAEVYDLL